jgi:hypothetical protein
MTPWSDLAALADRELGLARDGRWEEAQALSAERDALAPALPAPGPGDRAALELLVALQEQIVVEYTLARDAVAREISALTRGRGAVRGYAGAGAARPAGRVDDAA